MASSKKDLPCFFHLIYLVLNHMKKLNLLMGRSSRGNTISTALTISADKLLIGTKTRENK